LFAIHCTDQYTCPGSELGPTFRRNAEHFSDDGDGEGQGIFVDHVKIATFLTSLEEGGSRCFHPGTQAFDHARGESTAHQSAQACVGGRICEKKRLA